MGHSSLQIEYLSEGRESTRQCRPDVKPGHALNSRTRTDEINFLEIKRHSLDIHLRSLEMKEKENE